MKTFKKNSIAMVMMVVLTCLTAWLIKMDWTELVDKLTFIMAITTAALWSEDFVRKFQVNRKQLTWQYFVGAVLIIGSVYSWLWASFSETYLEMFVRFGVTFLCATGGAIWMVCVYEPSILSREEKEQKRWAKLQRKVKTADHDTALHLLEYNLRYRLIADNLVEKLDTARPLCSYKDYGPLTFAELRSVDARADEIEYISANTKAYLESLLAVKQ